MHVDGAKRIETCCPPVRNSKESESFDLVKCGDRSSGCAPQSCWSASGRGPGYFAPLPARFQCTTMAYCKCTSCARQQPLGPVDVGPSSEGSSRLLDSRQPSLPRCACGGSLNKRTRQRHDISEPSHWPLHMRDCTAAHPGAPIRPGGQAGGHVHGRSRIRTWL